MKNSLFRVIKNKHFLSLTGNSIMALLSIATYAILYRVMSSPEDTGNWVFYQLIFTLMEVARTGFLQTALIKFYAGTSEQRRKEIAGSTWFIGIVITLLYALLCVPGLFFFDSIHDESIRLLLKWSAITFFCTLPFNVALWTLQAEERFDKILYLRIVNQGSFVLLIILYYLLNRISLANVVFLYFISSFISGLLAIMFGWVNPSNLRDKSKKSIWEIIHFGKFSLATNISSSLLRFSDTIIIKFMLGPADLAIYNLPQRMTEMIEIPLRSFLGTAIPAMSTAENRGDKRLLLSILKKYVGVVTVLIIPIIFVAILFAPFFVKILAGRHYVDTASANILRIFMLLSILSPLDRFMGVTLDILHRPKLNTIKVTISLIVNVVADIIAILIFKNVYGVAAASFLTILIGVMYGLLTLKKFLPFNLNGILKLGVTELQGTLAELLRSKVSERA